jgi:hypothetical protein
VSGNEWKPGLRLLLGKRTGRRGRETEGGNKRGRKGVCVSLPLEENGLPVYFPPLSQEFQMNYIGVLYKII